MSPCVGESLNWVLDSDGARFPFPLSFSAFPWLCMVSPMSLGPGVEALLLLAELPPSLFSVTLSTYFGKIAFHEPINSWNASKCGQSSIGLLPSPKNASWLSPVCNSLRDKKNFSLILGMVQLKNYPTFLHSSISFSARKDLSSLSFSVAQHYLCKFEWAALLRPPCRRFSGLGGTLRKWTMWMVMSVEGCYQFPQGSLWDWAASFQNLEESRMCLWLAEQSLKATFRHKIGKYSEI